jgi:hypothetical protein
MTETSRSAKPRFRFPATPTLPPPARSSLVTCHSSPTFAPLGLIQFDPPLSRCSPASSTDRFHPFLTGIVKAHVPVTRPFALVPCFELNPLPPPILPTPATPVSCDLGRNGRARLRSEASPVLCVLSACVKKPRPRILSTPPVKLLKFSRLPRSCGPRAAFRRRRPAQGHATIPKSNQCKNGSLG